MSKTCHFYFDVNDQQTAAPLPAVLSCKTKGKLKPERSGLEMFYFADSSRPLLISTMSTRKTLAVCHC